MILDLFLGRRSVQVVFFRWRHVAGHVIRGEAFFMGPLYPYFMAFVYSVFGESLLLKGLIQIAGGSLAGKEASLISSIGATGTRRESDGEESSG